MSSLTPCNTDENYSLQVITQIWVLLLGGLGLGALLDVWVSNCFCAPTGWWNLNFHASYNAFQAGHDFPIVFYLAVGGSLLSYIYSAPPLKVLECVFFITDSLLWKIHPWDATCLLIERCSQHYIISAQAEWMDWELRSGCKLHQLALVWSTLLISLHVAQTVLVLMLPSLYSQELKGIKYILQVGWPGVIWNSYTGYRCLDYFVQHSWGISSPHPVWLSFDHSYMSWWLTFFLDYDYAARDCYCEWF